MKNIKKRAVLYCRVSTKEQVEEGNSLPTQERICKEYALENGYEIVSIFIEKGKSAKTQNRKELQNLLSFCTDKKNAIDAVIAYKIDRISRNVDDYSKIRFNLKRYGVEIKSTSENIENTPAGRFMENMLANVSEFDNDIRTERSVNGMKDAMRAGRHIGRAPYGYENRKVHKISNIYPNADSVLAVEAFKMVAKNDASVYEIRAALFKKGMVTGKGKEFSKSHFYRLLQNEVYAGWINKFGERHRGTYEPLISEELFKTVQYVLKRRSHKGFIYKIENEDFPLRRFVFHPLGNKITGYWAQGSTKRYPYYRFKTIKQSDCRKETLEKLYMQFLNKYKFNTKKIEELLASIDDAYNKKAKTGSLTNSKLKTRIADLKDTQTALIQKNIKGVISDDILKEQLAIVDHELEEAYRELSTCFTEEFSLVEISDKAIEYLKNPAKIWSKASLKERLRLQWFEFPHGVILENGKFRTNKVVSIFKAKNKIEPYLSRSVRRARHRSNRLLLPKYQEYAKQIKDLSEILTSKHA